MVAEFDVKPEAWFFGCHFKGDPVMPGCLGLDALWQLTGFFLGWLGLPGRGRALGVGEVKFADMVLPTVKKVVYGVDVKRIFRGKLNLAIADGWLEADSRRIYEALNLRVGLFGAAAPAGAEAFGRGEPERLARESRMRRVVVTGMGIVSSIGNNTQEALASLHSARSGITRAEKYAELGFRCQVHGAPDAQTRRHPRPPRHALSRRRHRLVPCRHGPGDPRRRRSRLKTSPTSGPASSWAPAARRRAPSSRRPT